MKQFLKFVLASIVGGIILFFIGVFLMVGMLSTAVSNDTQTLTLKDKSILEITMAYGMPDRAMAAMPTFDGSSTVGLNTAMEALNNAKTDDKIQGIFLNLALMGDASLTTVQEFRQAIEDFKTSGKFVWAYSDTYSQTMYYLASVADKVYLHNEGQLLFNGLSSQSFFLKGALAKLGVDMQIIRHGKYKSAIEPFVNEQMSPENREQTQRYLNGLWNAMIADISKSRNIPAQELNRIADEMLAMEPEAAQELNMIDDVISHNDMLQLLADAVKEENIEKLEFVDFKKYAKAPIKAEKTSKNRIAVIYAQGEIGMGQGAAYAIGSESMSQAIRKAANDDKIKAIVLRVNSPGGSALASDIILQEIMAAKAKKPVVASFGRYAASGGYYISCGANYIFAQPTTLTGSIGVFGTIPNIKELLNEKLGVTTDEVSTNTNGGFLNLTRPMTTFEQTKMQAMIERVYGTFITHVANGRNLNKDYVDSIGQGRVWNGTDAKEIGLVDEIGGLKEALAKAAELAKIDDYKIYNYPKEKDQFQQIMEMLGETKIRMVKSEMGDLYPMYEFCKSVSLKPQVMARLPYIEEIR
ncbi:MAG: signal peptide peptidase SppA [Bacteroidales bacterium]|jgi:protease-4|nr:signal peptide peptidase SppA [Bacteroidales bacterium]